MQPTFIWHGALLCTSPAVFTAKGGAAKDEGSRPVGRPLSSGELTPDAKWAARRTRERQCSARKSTLLAPAEAEKSPQGLADSHVDEGACSVAGVGASTRSGSPAAQSMSVARDGLCESLPSCADLRVGQDNFSGNERAEAPMIGLESSPIGREDRGPHERRLARGSATEAHAINFHLAWRVALHLASCVPCQRGGGRRRTMAAAPSVGR